MFPNSCCFLVFCSLFFWCFRGSFCAEKGFLSFFYFHGEAIFDFYNDAQGLALGLPVLLLF